TERRPPPGPPLQAGRPLPRGSTREKPSRPGRSRAQRNPTQCSEAAFHLPSARIYLLLLLTHAHPPDPGLLPNRLLGDGHKAARTQERFDFRNLQAPTLGLELCLQARRASASCTLAGHELSPSRLRGMKVKRRHPRDAWGA